MNPQETDTFLSNLQTPQINEIASNSFLRQFAVKLEECSLIAHGSAVSNSDEHIVYSILLHSKVPVLVETLLTIEKWRVKVLSVLLKEYAELFDQNPQNVLRVAFTLHVEVTLVNLLNLILFHRESIEENMDSHVSIALIDYCARRMVRLSTSDAEFVRRQKSPVKAEDLTNYLSSRTPTQEILDICMDTEYKVSVASVSVARYICEYVEDLPLSAMTRILDTHDFMILIVPLIEEPPWTRRQRLKEGVVWEKYIENEWKQVPPAELLHVTQCEAQCWLALFSLTASKSCRERYGLNSFRKTQFLRLRKYLNEIMLDQLPILGDVMRYMDELSLINVPENMGTAAINGITPHLLLQEVPIIEDRITKNQDWDNVASVQSTNIFVGVSEESKRIFRCISDVYSNTVDGDILDSTGKNLVQCEPTSQSINLVKLSFESIDNEMKCDIELKCAPGDGKIVQTQEGMFKRFQLIASSSNDSVDASIPSSSIIQVFDDMNMTVSIIFNGKEPYSISKDMNNIELPVPMVEEDTSEVAPWIVPLSLPEKKWRQLGSLKEKLVVQICFNRVKETSVRSKKSGLLQCYELGHIYIAQPA